MKLLEGKEEKENLFNDLFCPTSSPYKFEYQAYLKLKPEMSLLDYR